MWVIVAGIIIIVLLGCSLIFKKYVKETVKQKKTKNLKREEQLIIRGFEFLWNKLFLQRKVDWPKTIVYIRYLDFFHIVQMCDGRYACCYGKDIGFDDPIKNWPQIKDEGFECDENFVTTVIEYLNVQNIKGFVEELEHIYAEYTNTSIMAINMAIEYHWRDVDLWFCDNEFIFTKYFEDNFEDISRAMMNMEKLLDNICELYESNKHNMIPIEWENKKEMSIVSY